MQDRMIGVLDDGLIGLLAEAGEFFPFAAAVAQDKAQDPADPVNDHGDPDPDGSHSHPDTEKV